MSGVSGAEWRVRKSGRLPGFDYSTPGAYFVTLSTAKRRSLFGQVVDGTVRANWRGRLVESAWLNLPRRFPDVTLDAYMMMPDHVHGVVFLQCPGRDHGVGAGLARPAGGASDAPTESANDGATLGQVIGAFKSLTTVQINRLRDTPGALVWQRGYYDRVIRDERELDAVRAYIANNPLKAWTDHAE